MQLLFSELLSPVRGRVDALLLNHVAFALQRLPQSLQAGALKAAGLREAAEHREVPYLRKVSKVIESHRRSFQVLKSFTVRVMEPCRLSSKLKQHWSFSLCCLRQLAAIFKTMGS